MILVLSLQLCGDHDHGGQTTLNLAEASGVVTRGLTRVPAQLGTVLDAGCGQDTGALDGVGCIVKLCHQLIVGHLSHGHVSILSKQ